jgi:hypothetical protein
MKTVAKPKVFISYTWRPDDPSNPNDKPQARGLELAEVLLAKSSTAEVNEARVCCSSPESLSIVNWRLFA